MQGKVGEGGVTAEVSVGALVECQGRHDIRFQICDKQGAVDIGPVDARVGYFGFKKIVEGLFAGGGGGDGIAGVDRAGGKAACVSMRG